MLAIEQRPAHIPLSVACRVLGLNRSTVYQHRSGLVGGDSVKRCRQHAPQPRGLSEQERQQVLDTLRSPPHCNQPPAEVYERCLSRVRPRAP